MTRALAPVELAPLSPSRRCSARTLRREALQRIHSVTLDAGQDGKGASFKRLLPCHHSRVLTHVGRVVGLWRYPVKSMAAEKLSDAEVSWHGIAGDRRWAFIRSGVTHSGFPWLTLRERSDMNHYVPSFLEPAHPDKSPTIVRTPSGAVFDVTDPALAAELYPDGARVIRQDRGVFDTFPLSLVTTQTLSRLSEMVGAQLDVARFRPNILVETVDNEAFAEDRWVGCTLRIGAVRVRIDKRDGRCAVITIDPRTSKRDPAILRTVAQEREGCVGVYGSTVQPGRIQLNDAVLVESVDVSVEMSG